MTNLRSIVQETIRPFLFREAVRCAVASHLPVNPGPSEMPECADAVAREVLAEVRRRILGTKDAYAAVIKLETELLAPPTPAPAVVNGPDHEPRVDVRSRFRC